MPIQSTDTREAEWSLDHFNTLFPCISAVVFLWWWTWTQHMCTYTQLSASNTTFSFTKYNRHPSIQTCEKFSHNTEFCRDQMPWWCSQPIWAPLSAKLQSLLYHTLHSYKIVLCYSRYVLFLKFIHLILFERKTKQERYKRRERERKCKAPFLVQSWS